MISFSLQQSTLDSKESQDPFVQNFPMSLLGGFEQQIHLQSQQHDPAYNAPVRA